jgi:hypothetical protein
LGGVGWYVWHSKNETDKTLNQVDKTSSSQLQSKESSLTNKQSYLIVKEWNIKLPLTNSISDAYYVVSTNSQDNNGQTNTVWLGLKSLDSFGCSANQANKSGSPLAGLIKAAPADTDPVSGATYKDKDPNGSTVDAYYYGYVDYITHRPCTTKADLQQKLKDVNAAFADAAKKITKE